MRGASADECGADAHASGTPKPDSTSAAHNVGADDGAFRGPDASILNCNRGSSGDVPARTHRGLYPRGRDKRDGSADNKRGA